MTSLFEIAMQKASGVIEVSHISDKKPTIQKRDDVLKAIAKEDPEFVASMPKGIADFTFGDKYFYRLNDHLVCIPNDCQDLSNGLLAILKEPIYHIIQGYDRMNGLMEGEGHFDISDL